MKKRSINTTEYRNCQVSGGEFWLEPSEFKDIPVIDCHAHFAGVGAGRLQLSPTELNKMGAFMAEVIKRGRLSQTYISGRDAALYSKAQYPELFYAGGFAPWSGETDQLPDADWEKYIRSLIELGFDGVGEMGSKPVPRSRHVPLDGCYYEGFWDACEAQGFPVLCHVADPEEFWDEKLAPDWAKKKGWVYHLEDYPTKEELYRETESVLDAHPDLRIVLCHFYFISADIERASTFLDCYRNANFDLTLGIELMHNISRRRDDWRDFFIKYQDRIFFGTDISTWQTVEEAIDRIWLVRNFLESDDKFHTPETADELLTRYKAPFLGLDLPPRALRKIYSENFQRLWGSKPRKVNTEVAISTLRSKGETAIAEALERLAQEPKKCSSTPS